MIQMTRPLIEPNWDGNNYPTSLTMWIKLSFNRTKLGWKPIFAVFFAIWLAAFNRTKLGWKLVDCSENGHILTNL